MKYMRWSMNKIGLGKKMQTFAFAVGVGAVGIGRKVWVDGVGWGRSRST
jgi:hypothetical protein